jgi:histone acetyltransferase (RNA polymerase elongator complex component)
MSKHHYIIPIFVPHSGCPHDCIFCNQKKITGIQAQIRGTDVTSIIDTYLETIDRRDAFVEVSFFGGSFTGIPIEYQNELLEAAREALNEKKIDAIRLSTRPDYIDEAILDNLKEYNASIIELGVQSMDNEVLRISERGHSIDDVVTASRLIKKWGFTLGLQMMVGLPGDNEKKDILTARELIALEPDFVRIYPALVIKDTYMEYMYRNNLYNPLSVDEAVEICKKLFIMFTKAHIQIIRIGLQTTEQINVGKDVVSGPFHPAFRELVESSLLNDMMGFVINAYFEAADIVEISISPKDISKLYADKKKYFYSKVKEFKTKNIYLRQEPDMKSMELGFNDGKMCRTMSLYEYIIMVN